MATSITKDKKKIAFTAEATLKFADGVIAKVPASITAAIALAAYVKAILIPPVTTGPPVTTVPVTDTRKAVTPVVPANGELYLGSITDQVITIPPGTLRYLNITRAVNCKIVMTGVDMPNGTIDVDSADGIEIFGCAIHDHSYRPISFGGLSNDVYIHDITFTNVANYVITNNSQVIWDGTDKTASKNWKLDRLTFKNTSTLFNSGSAYAPEGVRNLMKNFSFTNCIVSECPTIGDGVYLGACDGYTLANNVFDRVNLKNISDVGMFLVHGTGSIYGNKLTNHEGYLCRCRAITFGPTSKSIIVDNNIVMNSIKYSAIEVQTIQEMKDYIDKFPDRVSPASSVIYGNIGVSLSTSKDWAGMVAVIYNTYAPVLFHDNIGVNLYGSDQDASRVYYSWADENLTPITAYANINYKTSAEAIKANTSLTLSLLS